jgi:hypothetical protein
MATAPWFSAPLPAAPEFSDYSQFTQCAVPEGSGAHRAYKGFIRPFSDDETAKRVLRALESDRPVEVVGGRLDADFPELPNRPLESSLVDMAMPFTVLALELDGAERPRTYLIDPPMVPRLSACGHLRIDKSIEINGTRIPALCVYSGALFKFQDSRSPLEQILDQTATYLAKYLVWLRTRNLFRRTSSGVRLVRKRKPHEIVTTHEIDRSKDLFWNGYWPGRSAPSTHAAHLNSIKSSDECWCWSGEWYGGCCKPRELKIIANIQRDIFVRRLMFAVHSKLKKA